MKYLLKIKKKQDHTDAVSIKLQHELKEFESLKELIDHLFENAIFIESYEIFEVNEFEKKEDSISVVRGTDGNILLSGNNSYSQFN